MRRLAVVRESGFRSGTSGGAGLPRPTATGWGRAVAPPPRVRPRVLRRMGTLAGRQQFEMNCLQERDGRVLSRLITSRVPWSEAHEWAFSASGMKTGAWLLRAFRESEDHADAKSLEKGDRLVRFLWSCLRTAQPNTVIGYSGKLLAALRREGETGYGTLRYRLAVRGLRRLSAMVRAQQPAQVLGPEILAALESLRRHGDMAARALLALAWILAARVPDLPFVVPSDVTELPPRNDDPTRVGLTVVIREKGVVQWRPGKYLPPGPVTGIVVAQARLTAALGCRGLFCETVQEYEELKATVRRALPAGSVLAGVRRGAAHAMQATGASVTQVGHRLGHAASTARQEQVTGRYVREVAAPLMREVAALTAGMQ